MLLYFCLGNTDVKMKTCNTIICWKISRITFATKLYFSEYKYTTHLWIIEKKWSKAIMGTQWRSELFTNSLPKFSKRIQSNRHNLGTLILWCSRQVLLLESRPSFWFRTFSFRIFSLSSNSSTNPPLENEVEYNIALH